MCHKSSISSRSSRNPRSSRFSRNSRREKQNNQLKIKITMSQKSNIRRAKYAAEQEKKAKKVIKGIIWTLVVLTAAFIVWSLTQV